MARAVTCPICAGSGYLIRQQFTTYGANILDKDVCHGCGGKGWVEVSE